MNIRKGRLLYLALILVIIGSGSVLTYCGGGGSGGTSVPYNYTDVGKIVQHQASSEDDYPWVSYASNKALTRSKVYIAVTAVDEDQDVADNLTTIADGLFPLFNKFGFNQFILLGVAMPSEGDIQGMPEDYYPATPAELSPDHFDDTYAPIYRRPDLKARAIIEQFIQELRGYGIPVESKVLTFGFSRGGMFSHRFAMLQPDIVQAVATGDGTLTLCVESYDNVRLTWPAGIHDFESLTGKPFNYSEYLYIPKFVFVGEDDDNYSVFYLPGYGYNDLYELEQAQLLHALADTAPESLRALSEIMNAAGDNILFQVYPDVDHRFAGRMIDGMSYFFENYTN